MKKNFQVASGLVWKIISCFAFATVSALIKSFFILYHKSLSPMALAFYQLSFSFVILWSLQRVRSGTQLTFQQLWHLSLKPYAFCRALCATGGMIFWLTTLSFYPLTVASMVKVMTPLTTLVFAMFFLKEKMNAYRLIGFILSFLGILWILTQQCSFQSASCSPFDLNLFAPLSALILFPLCHIFGKLALRKYGDYDMTLSFLFLSFLFLCPWVIWQKACPSLEHIPLLLAISLTSSLAYLSLNRALARELVVNLVPVNFLRFLFTICLGIFFFNESVSYDFWITSFVVCLAVLCIFYQKKQTLS